MGQEISILLACGCRIEQSNQFLPFRIYWDLSSNHSLKTKKFPEFDNLLSTPAPDICDASDIRSLFRIGEPLNHTRLNCITFTIKSTPFSISGPASENLYIFGWDLNIRSIIETLERSGHSNRNTSEHTVTRNLRPDYNHTVDDKYVLRGEEKGPQSLEDPKEELSSKLEWVYDPAPYIFGR